MKRIIYIGGGTGSLAVLGGLNKLKNCQLAGVYPITDDGGSTGRLIKDNLDLLPMGDLRQMIFAMVDKNEVWQNLLDYRFEAGDLKGHNLGNILLVGLQDLDIDINKFFKIKADLLPVSLKKACLYAKLETGQIIKSETKIDEVIDHDGHFKIVKVWVRPRVRINSEVRKAILGADLIIIGPGDLYTSVAACLVVSGVAKAIRASRARKVYVCNLMTKFGQTNNFSVQDHAKVVQEILGGNVLDYVVYNNKRPNKKILDYYKKERGCFVEFHVKMNTAMARIRFKGVNLLGLVYKKSKDDVLKRSLIRHNSDKLAKILLKLL